MNPRVTCDYAASLPAEEPHVDAATAHVTGILATEAAAPALAAIAEAGAIGVGQSCEQVGPLSVSTF